MAVKEITSIIICLRRQIDPDYQPCCEQQKAYKRHEFAHELRKRNRLEILCGTPKSLWFVIYLILNRISLRLAISSSDVSVRFKKTRHDPTVPHP